MGIRIGLPLACVILSFFATVDCRAAGNERDSTWGDVTTVTAISALSLEVLMPRVFYSDPEATVGWKARWHVSALAPVMTLVGVTTLNEFALKDAFKGHRP